MLRALFRGMAREINVSTEETFLNGFLLHLGIDKNTRGSIGITGDIVVGSNIVKKLENFQLPKKEK